MSGISSTILLWLFVINLGIAFGAGLYEHRIVVSRWITSSPETGQHWNPEVVRQDDTGRRFWIFVTTVPLTLLTLANLFCGMACLWAHTCLVAGRSPCSVDRPCVHVWLFHPNDGRIDAIT